VERDPRTDPRSGDVLRVEPWTFTVVAVKEGPLLHPCVYVHRVHDTDDDETASARVCVSIAVWLDEMARATVEHTATDEALA
jgi:hypothetical protein